MVQKGWLWCLCVMKREEFRGSVHTHVLPSICSPNYGGVEMPRCITVPSQQYSKFHLSLTSVVLFSHSQPANSKCSTLLSDCFTIYCRGSATKRTGTLLSRDVTSTVMKTPHESEYLYTSWWRKPVPLCKFWQIYKHWNFLMISSHHTCELLYEVRCVLHFWLTSTDLCNIHRRK